MPRPQAEACSQARGIGRVRVPRAPRGSERSGSTARLRTISQMDCRLVVAQTNPALGDLGKNLEDHLQRIDAAAGSADLILFPELSLTGYFLRDQVEEVALAPEDAFLRPLLEQSKRISIAFGFVERSREG